MDGVEIVVVAFVVVIVCTIAALLVWARGKGRVRQKAVNAMIEAIGFQQQKEPPADFPLKSFPAMRWGEKGGRFFSSVGGKGTRGGRQVLFFDYFLMQGQGRIVDATVGQTFVAVRGGPVCFEAITDPSLKLESAEGWTIAYWHKKILPAEEIQAIVLAIPETA